MDEVTCIRGDMETLFLQKATNVDGYGFEIYKTPTGLLRWTTCIKMELLNAWTTTSFISEALCFHTRGVTNTNFNKFKRTKVVCHKGVEFNSTNNPEKMALSLKSHHFHIHFHTHQKGGKSNLCNLKNKIQHSTKTTMKKASPHPSERL